MIRHLVRPIVTILSTLVLAWIVYSGTEISLQNWPIVVAMIGWISWWFGTRGVKKDEKVPGSTVPPK